MCKHTELFSVTEKVDCSVVVEINEVCGTSHIDVLFV